MGGCYNGKITSRRQIILPVTIAPPGFLETGDSLYPDFTPIPVEALVDTGASISGITRHAADLLGLESIDKWGVVGADGKSVQNVYLIDMVVPFPLPAEKSAATKPSNFKEFSDLEVVEFYGTEPSILFGMDLIMQGSLEVKGNKFTFCL